ncbi:MAG: hypothetical protein K0U93_06430 [Gammaproteobacteria bacterium]|nr:hypothetical protein [Gammaproteobacteria bacterium]
MNHAKDIDFDAHELPTEFVHASPNDIEPVAAVHDTPSKPTRSLAGFLRWIGAGLLGLAAVIYMVQGFNGIDVELRNWAAIGLVTLLGGGGALSLYAMGDQKGARLFFGLGTGLLPVQMSQLGGLVHELTGGVGLGIASLVDYSGVSALSLGTMGALSFAILVPVAFIGFSILARQHATKLTVWYVILGSAILLPFRASVMGVATIAAIAFLVAAIEFKHFRLHTLYRTPEGLAVRLMFLMPLLIALGRVLFYADEAVAISGGLACFGFILGILVPSWLDRPIFQHAFRVLGVTTLAVAWSVFAFETLHWARSAFEFACATLPLAGLMIGASYLSEGSGRNYRTFGVLIGAGVLTLMLLSKFDLAGSILSATIAIAFITLAVLHRERIPLIVGVPLLAVSVVGLVLMALESYSMSAWVGLAGAGVAIVIFSSVIEKHGRTLRDRSGHLKTVLTQWS